MIIDGKAIAYKIKAQLKEKVAKLKTKPGLAMVLVGDNPASQVYVNSKEKACREIGFYSKTIILPKEVTQEKLNLTIEQLNNDNRIHGVLIQLPLPARNAFASSACVAGGPDHLNEEETLSKINPLKDVDGLSPINLGKLFRAKKITSDLIIPATPKGILTLIKSTGIKISGKKAVVIGRSNLVGKPVAQLLLAEDATVTICHSKTENLSEITKTADILVAAIGKPKLVTIEMVKKGAVVIDVGINRIEAAPPRCKAKLLVGDVDFEEVKKVAGYITPVPGGVGPMTIASLMENTLKAYLNQKI